MIGSVERNWPNELFRRDAKIDKLRVTSVINALLVDAGVRLDDSKTNRSTVLR